MTFKFNGYKTDFVFLLTYHFPLFTQKKRSTFSNSFWKSAKKIIFSFTSFFSILFLGEIKAKIRYTYVFLQFRIW